MTIIKPTIGRRVWYWPGEFDGVNQFDLAQPCDAGIAYVHSDRMVNLTVAGHDGMMHSRCSVPLLQDGDQAPAAGRYAQWMPYQVGQAAKHAPEAERNVSAPIAV
jgi:hypothetical protein